jgi:membrane protease YdiL (CAAX protease family)
VPLEPPAPAGVEGAARWKGLLITVVLYPILEEWIYRGVLYPPLEARSGRWPAIVISGLVFQALHLAYGIHWPHYFVGGMILAWAFAKSRSLIYPIFLHGLWNLFVAVVDMGRTDGWIGF